MPDDKKSSYRGFTEAQARAHKKYISNFVEVKVRMSPEHREEVRHHAEQHGESLNGFINRAIDEQIKRDTSEKENEK